MNMLGGDAATQARTPPAIQGIGIQTSTSVNGIPIAVVLGTNRIPANLIWFGDFNAVATAGGGGGKGLGNGTQSTTIYYASMQYGMCVGPIQGVGQDWLTSATPDTPPTHPGNSFQFQEGAPGQTPWSYMLSNHPDEALGYNGVAVYSINNKNLGDSASLPNYTFEVLGRGIIAATDEWTVPPNASAWSTSYAAPANENSGPFAAVTAVVKPPGSASNIAFDTSPAWCVAELLTDSTWGAGLPAAMLGDLTGYATWCQAAGLVMSPALTTQRAARDVLKDWLDATIADVFWSQGQIKLMPYADSPVTGTAADGSALTYTPDMVPVMTIDDSLMLPGTGSGSGGDEGPITVTVADQTDLYNQVGMEYNDRANAYNTLPAIAENDAHIAQFGLRPGPSLQGDFITSANVANLIVDLALARHLGVQATYDWRMRSPGELLEPFDVVEINDAAQGLVNYPVRVTMVEEEDDSVFHVTAEDIPGLIGTMQTRAAPVNAGFVSAFNADPGLVNAPVIFEPPGGLLTSGSGLEAWGAVSGASANYGGCQVWVSQDGESYQYLTALEGGARQGVLTAALPSFAQSPNPPTVDNTDTLAVNVSESNAQLLSVSQASALALSTNSYVDGELIAYQTATLTASGQYNLTGLVRGAYGSTIGAHMAGAQFARLDQAVFKYPFTPNLIGSTVYFKFLPFNTLEGALYTLDEVEPYAYTIKGTALTAALPDVTNLGSQYIGGSIELAWSPVVDPLGRAIDYEIRLGTNPASAMIVGRVSGTTSPILGDGTYWVAAHYKVPNGPDIYSPIWESVSVSNSTLIANEVATYDAASDGWSGTMTNTAVIGGNLSLSPSGNILAAGDVFAINDVRYFGGVVASGSYEIPASKRVTLTTAATCNVIIKLGAIVGLDINAVNILTVADITQLTDVVGTGLGTKVSVTPQVRTSQDGVTWGAWQNWQTGASYTGKVFDCQVLLATSDPTVAALLSNLDFTVNAPTVTQQSPAVVAAGSGGASVTFPNAFNGGPITSGGGTIPALTITIEGGANGDSYELSARSLTGFTIQFFNGGVAVARSFTWIAQGY